MPKKKKEKQVEKPQVRGRAFFLSYFSYFFSGKLRCLLEEFRFLVFSLRFWVLSFRFKSNLNGTRNYFRTPSSATHNSYNKSTFKVKKKPKKKRKTKVDSKLGRNHDLMRL